MTGPRFTSVVVTGCLAALTAFIPVAAQARDKATTAQAEAVTLTASRTKMKFGGSVKLTGAVSPATADQTVAITDEVGATVAEAITDDAGEFETVIEPRANATLQALWLTATSEPVPIKVRPIVDVKLRKVKLFGKAIVRGNVRPAMPEGRIKLRLKHNGKTIGRRTVALEGRFFRGRLPVRKPGNIRARAIVISPDHLRASHRSGRRVTPLPALGSGSSGDFVRLLERRLIDLGYYLPGADRSFDVKTSDALLAFNKVQRRARVGTVDADTWRKLADPIRPRPRFDGPEFHLEIDQTRQVIFVVVDGKVRKILHTSTGAGGATRDGSFRVTRKLAGTSGGGLYYPSYFDGLRAIHGWPEVPTYPASHGCSRVPMWAATWIFSKAPIGTRVHVYH